MVKKTNSYEKIDRNASVSRKRVDNFHSASFEDRPPIASRSIGVQISDYDALLSDGDNRHNEAKLKLENEVLSANMIVMFQTCSESIARCENEIINLRERVQTLEKTLRDR